MAFSSATTKDRTLASAAALDENALASCGVSLSDVDWSSDAIDDSVRVTDQEAVLMSRVLLQQEGECV